jgi:hypothetical protein
MSKSGDEKIPLSVQLEREAWQLAMGRAGMWGISDRELTEARWEVLCTYLADVKLARK